MRIPSVNLNFVSLLKGQLLCLNPASLGNTSKGNRSQTVEEIARLHADLSLTTNIYLVPLEREAAIKAIPEIVPLLQEMYGVNAAEMKSRLEHIINKYDAKFIVARSDDPNKGKLLGLVNFRHLDSFGGDYLFVNALMCDKEHRRQGIGEALMGAVVDYATNQNIKYISTDTFKTSERNSAQKIMDKLGFKNTKFNKGFSLTLSNEGYRDKIERKLPGAKVIVNPCDSNALKHIADLYKTRYPLSSIDEVTRLVANPKNIFFAVQHSDKTIGFVHISKDGYPSQPDLFHVHDVIVEPQYKWLENSLINLIRDYAKRNNGTGLMVVDFGDKSKREQFSKLGAVKDPAINSHYLQVS